MIRLVTVVGSYVKVLPHMLAHYQNLGVDGIELNVHLNGREDPIYEEIEAIARRFGLRIHAVASGPWLSCVNPDLYAKARRGCSHDWFLLADQDELQVYSCPLRELLDECDARGYRYVSGCFVDRLAAGGRLGDVDADRPLETQFPLGGWLSYPLFGATPNKIVAVKGESGVGDGQHWPAPLAADVCPPDVAFTQVHHFKWVSGLLPRLERRVADYVAQQDPTWKESRRVLDYLAGRHGRFDVDDPELLIAPCQPDYRHWPAITRLACEHARRHYRDRDAPGPFFASSHGR